MKSSVDLSFNLMGGHCTTNVSSNCEKNLAHSSVFRSNMVLPFQWNDEDAMGEYFTTNVPSNCEKT